MWRSHGLLAVKQRYRWAKAAEAYTNTAEAARALGISHLRLQYNRRLVAAGGFRVLCAPIQTDREIETAILGLIKEDASLSSVALMHTLQDRGTPVTEHAVDITLARFRLRTVARRVAAGGGLPAPLRELVELEPEIRRLLRRPRGSGHLEPVTARPRRGRWRRVARQQVSR